MPLISLLGTLAQTGANIVTNQINKNNAMQLQQMQNDFTHQMWQENNEYNTPTAQRERFEQAGLNPAYYMGQQGNMATQATQPSTPNTPYLQNPQIADFIDLSLRKSVVDADVTEKYANAGYSQAQTETINAIRDAQVEYQSILNDKTKEEVEQIQANINKLKSDASYTNALVRLTDTQKQYLEMQIKYYPLLTNSQIDECISRMEKNYSDINLNRSQRAYLRASIALLYAERETEYHKQNNLDKQAGMYSTQADVNRAEYNKTVAETENINAQTDAQDIQNEISRNTKESEEFRKKAANYTGVIFDFADRGLDIYQHRGNLQVLRENSKSARMNAEANRYDAHTRRVSATHAINKGKR